MQPKEENWDIVIKPSPGWLNLQLDDLWRYKDLLWMFVKRDFISVYKQTILGPLWFILQPILTTIMFMIVFTGVAKIPTGGIPSALFYMSGLTIWNYFSTTFNKISGTFTVNATIFGKVYFPRMVVPLSNVVSTLISFGIQFGLLLITLVYYIATGYSFHLTSYIFLLPVVLFLMAGLALGLGIIVSSMTTKYRDLSFLVSFGVQLLMYATPIIYPLSFIKGKYRAIIEANPLTSFVELFRLAIFGTGSFDWGHFLYSVSFTVVSVIIGLIIFNRVDKSFMDTV
jgi:lipopolysaccharide transport system permease protein